MESKNLLRNILLIVLTAFPIFAAPKDGSLEAGTAKEKITPEAPVPLSGFSNRNGPFKGVHDDIYARAIAFSDGENKAVIIMAELIGIPNSLYEEVTLLLERQTGIPRQSVILCAVHTHSGPVLSAHGHDSSPEIIAYVEELTKKLCFVAHKALENLRPAFLGTGNGICKMNINRRGRNTNGDMWIRRNPYGSTDQKVALVKISDEDGKSMAVFINWPCHATSIGSGNYLISGDWPGAASRYVENFLGVQVIAPVTVGASGDINPIYAVHDSMTEIGESEIIGTILGEEALRISNDLQLSSTGTVNGTQRLLNLPGKKREEEFKLAVNYEPSGTDVPLRITVLKVGSIVFVGISGEVAHEIGLAIKEQSPYRQTIVVTHCNGSSGYIPTDKAYTEGGYEVYTSRLMPGVESILIENVIDMINQL